MQSRIHQLFALVSAAVLLVLSAGSALALDAGGAGWPSFDQAAVLELTLINKGESIALYRDGKDWFVRPRDGEEISPRADGSRVNELLDFILHNKPLKTVGPLSGSGAAYGLDAPRASLAIEWSPSAAEALSLRVDLGKPLKDGSGLYAVCSLAPDSVVVLDQGYLRLLTAPAQGFYDRRIALFSPDNVKSVSLRDRNGLRWQVGASDGGYVFSRPEALEKQAASSSEIRMLLNNILSMRAEDMVLNRTEVGGTPDLELTIGTSARGGVQVIRLYGQGVSSKAYLGESTWQPGLFRLRPDQMQLFDLVAFDLQRRNVVEIDSSAVHELLIRTEDQRFTAVRAAEGWVSKDTGKLLLGIDMWLWRFNELRFEAEPSATLPESAGWVMTCEPVGNDGKLTAALTFYADPQLPEGQCWLKVGQEGPYFPVSNQLLRDMRGQLPAARSGSNE